MAFGARRPSERRPARKSTSGKRCIWGEAFEGEARTEYSSRSEAAAPSDRGEPGVGVGVPSAAGGRSAAGGAGTAAAAGRDTQPAAAARRRNQNGRVRRRVDRAPPERERDLARAGALGVAESAPTRQKRFALTEGGDLRDGFGGGVGGGPARAAATS